MKIFDAHIRSDTRSDTDLKNLHYFETERVVSTAHTPRGFERAEDLLAYFETLMTDECARLRRCGLKPHIGLGVLPPARPRRTHYEVWSELPYLLADPQVVALGEIGAWEDTGGHWDLFERQVGLLVEGEPMPVICTPPSDLKVNMTYKMMHRIERLGLPVELAMMNRLDERLVETVLAEGFVAGVAVGSNNLEPRQAARLLAEVIERQGTAERIVLNSALRIGGADVLGIPKTIVALQDLGVSTRVIEKLVYGNAMALFVTEERRI